MTRRLIATAIAAALAIVGLMTGATRADAYSQTSAKVERTNGMGVGCRTNPFGSIDCGYGAREGAVLQLICFYHQGDPVGPNRNKVWWRVTNPENGKTFFVADHWLDTPAPRNGIPTWYYGTGCL